MGEKLVIGDGVTMPQIEVMVVDIDRGKVRIGVHAPKSMPIFRSELLEAEKRDRHEGQAPDSGCM